MTTIPQFFMCADVTVTNEMYCSICDMQCNLRVF